MGGNIGTAILALQPPAQRPHATSIEMSSFQIELTPTLEPTVGILLNVSPDHLDRHGTMENYAGLKARLVQEATAPDRRRGRRLVPRYCRAPAARQPNLGRHRLGATRASRTAGTPTAPD